ncbi:hypothetical protein [Zongyangia hominis]|uniref:Uncharacterized protein n=1 Tax=Zongyangia hominis TaxID=2763677 RepID=A0A926ICH2_9FIRM|nr:hypothetical protein [Zongyangia hominis]MBC8571217.1 hypothetical protein [Zongyangia hominis]
MKKSILGRLGLLAFALCLVTTCLLSGTLARYTTEITGTGTANVAKWAIALNQGGTAQTTDYTFNLKDTKETNALVNDGTIAPGDKGKIDIEIDGTGSEVAYQYSIALNTDNFTETAGNIKFYSDASFTTAWTDVADQTVALASVGTPVSKSIYWRWEGGETNNANDTTAGKAAADLTFTITLTAEQQLA